MSVSAAVKRRRRSLAAFVERHEPLFPGFMMFIALGVLAAYLIAAVCYALGQLTIWMYGLRP